MQDLSITEKNVIKEVLRRRTFFQRNIVSWEKKNSREFPWRNEMTPYSILVAEVLLKRTTSTAAAKIFPLFLEKYANTSLLARANKTDLQDILLPLGYNIGRAKILIEVAGYIEKEYNGEIPSLKEELVKIPFIGQYTAGAIVSFGYDRPSSMVDSNVERIFRRFFCSILPLKGVMGRIFRIADVMAPERNNRIYSFGLLDHGALVCRYNKPRCSVCPVCGKCDFFGRLAKVT